MTLAAWVANSVWRLASQSEARRFTRAMVDIEATQRAGLARILRNNAGTAYGQRYGFADITSAEEYQARVPLVTYEDVQPEIARMAEGVPDILIPGQPSLFVPTSGSTAATKLIPYNQALRAEFQAGIAPWIVDMFRANPQMAGGPAYWSISPATWTQRTTDGGIPIGFDDDTAYLHPLIARLLGQAMAVPSAVACISDMDAFRYVTLAYLLRARELRFISVWNPTFLTLLLAPLATWAEPLARDLANGTLSPPGDVAPDVLALLSAPFSPNRRRAHELEQVNMEPAALWPHLALISCWTAAAAAEPARELSRLFPRVPIAGKGLLATEGMVSFPLHGLPGSALAVCGHFFEFLPVDGGIPRLAWQLDEGVQYQVVLTTGGGLYRYRLGDFVTVLGHTSACPLVEFDGRSNAVSDFYGEKLHEAHVTQAIRTASAEAGVPLTFALLAPEGQTRITHYTLFITTDAPVPADCETALRLMLERELCDNIHYTYCRQLGQLDAVNVCVLLISAREAQVRMLHAAMRKGMRAGEAKPVCLDRGTCWRERLTAV